MDDPPPPFEISLALLHDRILETPGLAHDVSLKTMIDFIHSASAMKYPIMHDQPPSFDPAVCPPVLSARISAFLADTLQLRPLYIQGLWTAFSDIIWEHGARLFDSEVFPHRNEEMDQARRLAGRTIYPTVQECNNPHCVGQRLLRHKAIPIKVTLFTLAEGIFDVWQVHLHCSDCDTEYYCDHSVLANTRTYYSGLPRIVQVADHTFLERALLEHFLKLSLLSWTSSTNAAHIYHNSLSGLGDDFDDQEPRYRLRTEHVMDGFAINALLKDAQERNYILRVPDDGDQASRFKAAMKARNQHMQDIGQPEFNHCCTKCVRTYKHEDGHIDYVDAIVLDGIDMGRPCCGVIHCTNELLRTQDRYCAAHWHLNHECVITGCRRPAEKDFRTCDDTSHRSTEDWWKLHGKGMFTLRKRLQRAQVSHPTDAVAPDAPADEIIEVSVGEDGDAEGFEAMDSSPANALADDASSDALDPLDPGLAAPPTPADPTLPVFTCPEKPAAGNRSLRATFGRRRTHNEQLGTRPCGIICFRDTFYGSETTPQVLNLIRRKYTEPWMLPRYCFYDNCCGLYMHSQASGETLHLEMGMPVDVFHWKTKHKKSNVACSVHCNPYNYPELMTPDETWFFNSSIAEQTNVWFGGYHAIIREMNAVMFDFFLDEMIKEKNRLTRQKLEAAGCSPGYRPVPE